MTAVGRLPTGTVTFLFTDLEGSTRLWEVHPEAMKEALARHDEILRESVESHAGHVVKTTGDGVLAAFSSAPQALAAAAHAQRSLEAEHWTTTGPMRVRMGVHSGEADLVDGDYHGPTLNRAARLMATAHGGQVVLSGVTEGLVADVLPRDVEIVDLGERRLRDLSRPEHVYQLIGGGWSSELGSLQTLDAFPSNLPLETTSFVGRDDEVTKIAAAFTERRLVTIIGVGGVGKTRVALQVAAEVVPGFPHGAWMCELAAASDADELVAVVAATLGVKPRAGVALEAAIQESLRDKQMLVVLDNCEHLLTAAGALAEGLLRRCPQVRLLATSREALAVDGEQVWPLRSLALPEAASVDPTTVIAAHAVQLFVDRARGAAPGFALDAKNVASVVDICRRLDGMPLAIELAAARTAAMSPSEIAQLLDERFRLLTGGRRTAVERHQTLRATVDWSYSLLEPIERLVFDRLGVFPGSFDAAAATAIVSGEGVEGWDVREALLAVVAKSLVVADQDQEGVTRYQMLETLRQYARERLDESGDADLWRRRHAEHFAELAEVAGPAVLGPDELPWRRRVGLELDNLRAAVTWGLDRDDPDDAELAIRIIAPLAFEANMMRASGLGGWAEKAVPRLAATTPARRASVLGSAGFSWMMRGDRETAASLAEEALREEITAEFPAPNMPVALQCNTLAARGDPRAAYALALHYAELFDARGIRLFDRCNIRIHGAVWAILSGELAAARRMVEQAFERAIESGNPSSLAMASFVLGWALEVDEPVEALTHLERSVALSRSGASDVVLANALSRIAKLRAGRGERLPALQALREAIVRPHEDGDLPGVSGSVDCGVIALALLGEPETAAEMAGSVLGGALAPMLMASPDQGLERDRSIEMLRSELGDDGYDTAFALGAGMTYDEIIGEVIGRLSALL